MHGLSQKIMHSSNVQGNTEQMATACTVDLVREHSFVPGVGEVLSNEDMK